MYRTFIYCIRHKILHRRRWDGHSPWPPLIAIALVLSAIACFGQSAITNTSVEPVPHGKGAFGILLGKQYDQFIANRDDDNWALYNGKIPLTNSSFESYTVYLTPLSHRAYLIAALHQSTRGATGEAVFGRVRTGLTQIYGKEKLVRIPAKLLAAWKLGQTDIILSLNDAQEVSISYTDRQLEAQANAELSQIHKQKADKTGL